MPVEFDDHGLVDSEDFNKKIYEANQIIEKALDDLGELSQVEVRCIESDVLQRIQIIFIEKILQNRIKNKQKNDMTKG